MISVHCFEQNVDEKSDGKLKKRHEEGVVDSNMDKNWWTQNKTTMRRPFLIPKTLQKSEEHTKIMLFIIPPTSKSQLRYVCEKVASPNDPKNAHTKGCKVIRSKTDFGANFYPLANLDSTLVTPPQVEVWFL